MEMRINNEWLIRAGGIVSSIAFAVLVFQLFSLPRLLLSQLVVDESYYTSTLGVLANVMSAPLMVIGLVTRQVGAYRCNKLRKLVAVAKVSLIVSAIAFVLSTTLIFLGLVSFELTYRSWTSTEQLGFEPRIDNLLGEVWVSRTLLTIGGVFACVSQIALIKVGNQAFFSDQESVSFGPPRTYLLSIVFALLSGVMMLSACNKAVIVADQISPNSAHKEASPPNEIAGKHFLSMRYMEGSTVFLFFFGLTQLAIALSLQCVRVRDTSSPPLSIFICYRRNDTKDVAGRLYDCLARDFGKLRIFKDVHSIQAGQEFPSVINKAVLQSDVILVLIGPCWSVSNVEAIDTDKTQKRDYVKFEIELGIQFRKFLIPVFVGDPAPSLEVVKESLTQDLLPLLHVNVARLRPDPDFHIDYRRLCKLLRDFQFGRRASDRP